VKPFYLSNRSTFQIQLVPLHQDAAVIAAALTEPVSMLDDLAIDIPMVGALYKFSNLFLTCS
jgi:hypothetical protein